ncbi:unnamed protein product [Oppiella nova]|uniref:Uncharacterized protein n=1 Tax=Oppiella nova TaxID=334625 RepID=A0A7R9QC58_9ACAR|nr:unnamed protein product [Oppiella nova]CAG2161981.1 unnamed protein product [Oppiella nova]
MIELDELKVVHQMECTYLQEVSDVSAVSDVKRYAHIYSTLQLTVTDSCPTLMDTICMICKDK